MLLLLLGLVWDMIVLLFWFLIISIAFGVGESNKVRQVRQIIPVGAVSGDKVRQARQIIPVGSVSGDKVRQVRQIIPVGSVSGLKKS